MSAVLLDTCAAIWLNESETMAAAAMTAIRIAARNQVVFVSPVSAWEVGLLARPTGSRPAMVFEPNVTAWIARLLAEPAIQIAPLTAEIALASTNLPGDFHRDPADRFIVATARSLDMPLITSDKRILDYAKAGHVRAIAC